ncbi:MAG: NAD(P)/FAD-dependent oxidoreductase [Haliea sp.]
MNQGVVGARKPRPWLVDAIARANIPTLACLLVQMTGDCRWIEGSYVPSRPRGLDDNDSGGLPSEVQAEVRQAALEGISKLLAGGSLALPDPSDELLVRMMSASLGEEIPLEYAPMIRHELGLAGTGTQQGSTTTRDVSPLAEVEGRDPPAGFRALIIGAGISGLCAAVNLDAAGIPYTIIERNSRLGGVWHENNYPGAACDVPSHLYSFSFAPYDWSRYFAASEEIQRYLEHVADLFDIRRHIRFNTEVLAANYNEGTAEWEAELRNTDGALESLRADMVISAVGAFNKPRYPDVPGIDTFSGPSIHTARWPEGGIELEGRRILVVGNGASAMQVVPAIADKAAAVTVIQRSTQWAAPFPKFLVEVPATIQRLMNEVPLYRLWYRLRLSWAFNDKQYAALQKDPEWNNGGLSINALNDVHRRGLTEYIKAELGDSQELLAQVLPNYPPFGKRMLMDNGWFRTLARKNVHLVTGAVTEVLPDRVRVSDGSEHEADVIIWATGFDVVNFLAPMELRGVGGRRLHDDWDGDDARAYLGTVVPGFPNFFCLYGPNTQFGHGGSLISIVERQMHYVMSLLQAMFDEGLHSVDVRLEVHEAYSREIDRRHEQMIWTHPGMSTYYRNSRGRVVVCNPFRIIEFWGLTDAANLAEFNTRAASGTESAVITEADQAEGGGQ